MRPPHQTIQHAAHTRFRVSLLNAGAGAGASWEGTNTVEVWVGNCVC